MSLRAYVSAKRGRAQQLAKAIGVHPVLVSQWASGTRQVPVEHCAALEIASDGNVRRWQMRPDDWQRIWPELANHPEAPRQQETTDAS